MKGIKKLLTGILAATMIMGASLNVCAADITIDRDDSYAEANAAGEQTYTYYKILSAEINSQGTVAHDTGVVTGGSASYYVDSEAKAEALKGTGLFDATKAGDSKWIITLRTDVNPTGDDIAKKINEILTSTSNPFGAGTQVPSTGDSTKIEGLDAGYYVITSSIGSTLIAQTLGENITIKEKNTYPGVKKEIKDTVSNKDWTHDGANVSVGDVVDYKLTVTVPATASKTVRVIDTMTQGLALVENSIAVKNVTDNADATDWTKVDAPEVAGASFQVNIDATDATKGKTFEITFKATITADAIVDLGEASKQNEVEIKYDNYSQKDYVPYDIYKTGLHKYDGTSNEALEGVKFSVYVGALKDKTTPLKLALVESESGNYYVPSATGSNIVVTGADGNFVIRGLDNEKTYWAYEEETLPGYNMPTTEDGRSKKLDVVNDEDTLASANMAQLENNTGLLLPSTGGIGTTIFYIVGAILIVAGIAYFIVRRKANAQ